MADFVASADGTQIAYEWHGNGAVPVVFVHGAGSDRTANAKLKALLSNRFRVISYDRRGRGGSGDTHPYRFEREVDDLRAVLKTVGNPAVILGTSMGARVALDLLKDPPTLQSMFLFEPPASATVDPSYEEKINQIEARISSGDPDGALELHSRLMHGRDTAQINAMRANREDWSNRVANIHVTIREMRAVHCDALFDAATYKEPSFPVHLIFGDQTLPFIRQSAERVAALPFVSVQVLEGHRHSAPRTHPEVIADAVISSGI